MPVMKSIMNHLGQLEASSRRQLSMIIVMLLGIIASPVLAQQSGPGTFADGHNPAGPPDPTKEAQIWKVDPINGSVSITIPFLHVRASSRGPFFPYSLQYNSSATYSLSSDIVPPQGSYDPDQGHTAFSWVSAKANDIVPAPWIEVGAPMLYYAESSPSYSQTGPGGESSQTTSCNVIGPVTLVDGTGSHDLNLAVISSVSGSLPGPCSGSSQPASSTTDGSTLITSWFGKAYAIYPDGTTLFNTLATGNSSIALEDSNGNYLTSSGTGTSGTVSDSLGRPLYSVIESKLTSQDFAYPTAITTYTTGAAAAYSLVWESVPYNFTFPQPTSSDILSTSGQYPAEVIPGPEKGSVTVLQSVALPDSTTYGFTYDPIYGTIQRITFPTGGYVRFVWAIRTIGDSSFYAFDGMSSLAVTDVYVSHGSTEDHWTYNCANLAADGLTCNVADPQGNETTYTGTGYNITGDPLALGASPVFLETSRMIYSSGKLIRTINTSYGGGGGAITLPVTITTTLNDVASGNPLQQQVKYTYDQYDNVLEKDESDWYGCKTGVCTPSSWLRKTLTTYYWAQPGNTSYQNAHIVDKPYTVTITDGSGTPVAETQYGYDEFALSGSTGIQNHDDTNFPASVQSPRGNKTTEKHCQSFSAAVCAAWVSTTYTYDLTGQVASVTDPCGNGTCKDMTGSHTTKYTYIDTYLNVSPSHPTNGFPTTITRPQTGAAVHSDTYSYYYNTGAIYQHTDENQKVTSYSYASPLTGKADPFNRIGEITLPVTQDAPAGTTAAGYTSYIYSDTTGAFSIQENTLMTSSNNQVLTQVTNYDPLGRVENTQLTTDPEGTVEVDTTYDSDGRVYSVSNPYRSQSDPTYGLTVDNTYDALGRKRLQTDPDGVSQMSWQYAGNIVTFTDENSNQWQRTSDGVGRLTKVLEPNAASQTASLETDYSYNSLDNLVTVSQCGGPCPSTSGISRSFSYDGVSRLVQTFNPETGWLCYGTTGGALPSGLNCTSGYDANGNLTSKTDARGVVTSYSYDVLNRLLSKTYGNDPATSPSACYQYDATSVSNSIGRLTSQWTQSASAASCSAPSNIWTRRSIVAYDAMGRVLSEQQCTPSTCTTSTPYAPMYTYDLAGHLYTLTNGIISTPTVGTLSLTQSYDSVGRFATVTSNWQDTTHPSTLFSLQTPKKVLCASSLATPYSAFGGLMNATFGSGLSVNRGYDNRLRTNCETDTGSVLVNSTLPSATVPVNGTEQSK